MRYTFLAAAIVFCGCGGNSLMDNNGDLGTPDLTASTGDMTSGPVDMTLPTTCDPIAQDCPSGSKCEIVGGMNGGARCTPAGGTVADGQPCMRNMGMPRDGGFGGGGGATGDNCAVGLQCVRIGGGGGGGGGSTSVCRKLCTKDGDCDSNQACALASGAVTNVGVCQPSCAPFGTDCTNGQTCANLAQALGSTQSNQILFFTCRNAGTTPMYGNCMRTSECAADLYCDPIQQWCTPLCDATHACTQPPVADGGNPDGGLMVTCQSAGTSLTGDPGLCQ